MKCTINGCESEATHQEVLDKTLPTGQYNCAEHAARGSMDSRITYEPLDPAMSDLYTCAVVWGDDVHTRLTTLRFAEYKVTLERMDEMASQPGVVAVIAERQETWVNVQVCVTPDFDPSSIWTIFR